MHVDQLLNYLFNQVIMSWDCNDNGCFEENEEVCFMHLYNCVYLYLN